MTSSGRPRSSHSRQRVAGRRTERHRAFLAALAEHAHDATLPVEVVDVEAAQLADADAGGVEQLDQGEVAQADRPVVGDRRRGRVDESADVVVPEDDRKLAVRLGAGQQCPGVGARPAGAVQPGGEHAGRGGSARQRGAGPAESLLGGQMASQASAG